MISLTTLFEQDGPQIIGKHNDVPDTQFDKDQLEMGIKVEMEHTDIPEIAKAIAKDHLSECSDYYTRLSNMEKECIDHE